MEVLIREWKRDSEGEGEGELDVDTMHIIVTLDDLIPQKMTPTQDAILALPPWRVTHLPLPPIRYGAMRTAWTRF